MSSEPSDKAVITQLATVRVTPGMRGCVCRRRREHCAASRRRASRSPASSPAPPDAAAVARLRRLHCSRQLAEQMRPLLLMLLRAEHRRHTPARESQAAARRLLRSDAALRRRHGRQLLPCSRVTAVRKHRAAASSARYMRLRLLTSVVVRHPVPTSLHAAAATPAATCATSKCSAWPLWGRCTYEDDAVLEGAVRGRCRV